jgi:hypothetical protein
MPTAGIIYGRTAAGERAWQCADSGLPVPYRRILQLVDSSLSIADIVAELREYSTRQVSD